MTRPAALNLRFFAVALLAWLLTTYPCVPKVYNTLVMSNASKFLMSYVALGLLGPAFVWASSRRLTSDYSPLLLRGCLAGLLAGVALWSRSGELPGSAHLDAGRFVYSGLLAGVVTAEARRRAILFALPAALSSEDLRKQFVGAALIIWAVLLKFGECIVVGTTGSGAGLSSAIIGSHIFLVLSIAVWTPWAALRLWRHEPTGVIRSVVRSCVLGVIMPGLTAAVLLFPVFVVLHMGMPLAYSMLWGGVAFVPSASWWVRFEFILPGLVWGVSVGLLRWHYLRLQRAADSTDSRSAAL